MVGEDGGRGGHAFLSGTYRNDAELANGHGAKEAVAWRTMASGWQGAEDHEALGIRFHGIRIFEYGWRGHDG